MVTPIRLSAAKPEVAEPKPIAKATALNTAVFFIKTLLLEKETLLLIFIYQIEECCVHLLQLNPS